MNYCVLTHTIHDGRIAHKSVIACVNRTEAEAMAAMLDGKHNPGKQTIERRAIVCVTGYTAAGKYLIPLDELTYIKSE